MPPVMSPLPSPPLPGRCKLLANKLFEGFLGDSRVPGKAGGGGVGGLTVANFPSRNSGLTDCHLPNQKIED